MKGRARVLREPGSLWLNTHADAHRRASIRGMYHLRVKGRDEGLIINGASPCPLSFSPIMTRKGAGEVGGRGKPRGL